MTSKGLFYWAIFLTSGLIAVAATSNYFLDVYGIFRDAKGRSIPVYANERTSKYLLSYNYIPANFNGLLVGPSFSNNMDPSGIAGYRIYNGSINGGNTSELRYIIENVIRFGRLRFIVICLHPYFTRDHGRKTTSINPREWWGAVGSLELVRVYSYILLHRFGLVRLRCNDVGYNDYIIAHTKGLNPLELIQRRALKIQNEKEIWVDPLACEELGVVLREAKSRKITIFAYFYPEPYEVFVRHEQPYRLYQEQINALFGEHDVKWDFNTDQYLEFRKDHRNYCDESHLSVQGAEFVLKEIKVRLDRRFRGERKSSVIQGS